MKICKSFVIGLLVIKSLGGALVIGHYFIWVLEDYEFLKNQALQ